MAVENPNSKIVVIDTDSYSGNFEREMCAFMTGRVGECGVGEGIAEEALDELKHAQWFEEHVTDECDDHGCARPASIWPSPGRFNDGYGTHFDDTAEVRATLKPQQAKANFPAYESVAVFVDELPPAEVLAEMVERAKLFCQQKGITYKGHRLFEPNHVYQQVQVVAGHTEVIPPIA
jgi:hypothetical protein